jgi:hypothetical protein
VIHDGQGHSPEHEGAGESVPDTLGEMDDCAKRRALDEEHTMIRLALCLLLLCCSGPVNSADSFRTESIVLLQPEHVIEARVESVTALTDYIKRVQQAAEAALVEELPTPAGGHIVLAVRPGGRSIVWLDIEPALPQPVAERLKAALMAVPPFPTRRGVVVFALNASLWGAPAAQGDPSPQEWREILRGQGEPMDVESIVDAVWPGDADPVPEGYVLQRLEETDGSILRPHDWHYRSEGTSSGWLWTISREEPQNGAYLTGLKIQLFLAVADKTGKSRETFALDFLTAKEHNAEVVNACDTEDTGNFHRRCLEVIEELPIDGEPTRFRILYSMLWGKDRDLVALTTFGSPAEEWESVEEIARTMAEFVLIGPDFGRTQE